MKPTRYRLISTGGPPNVRDYGAACDGTTDDSKALAEAANALANSGSILVVPGDCRIRLAGTNPSSQVWLRGIHLQGPAVEEWGFPPPYKYGSLGGTIIVDTPTLSADGLPPFVVSSGWSITGLKFYWPQQTEAMAAANAGMPVPFAPLIVPHVTNGAVDPVDDWQFEKNQVENAYDIIDLHTALDNVGNYHWSNNQEFAVHYHMRLAGAGGEGWVDNNQYSPAAAEYLVELNMTGDHLRAYATENGEVIRLDGNGTTSMPASSAYSVAGMRFTGNYVYGIRYGIHVVGGTFGLATMTDNGFDEVSTPIAADHGGLLSSLTVSGGTWICQNLMAPTRFIAPCMTISGGPGGNNVTLSNVQLADAVGPGIIFHDEGGMDSLLSIAGGDLLNFGNVSTGNPFNGLDFNAPNGVLSVYGLTMSTTAAANRGAKCIVVGAAKAATLSGINFRGCGAVLVVNATAGLYSLHGSTSLDSTARRGAPVVLGRGADLVVQSGNSWHVRPVTHLEQ